MTGRGVPDCSTGSTGTLTHAFQDKGRIMIDYKEILVTSDGPMGTITLNSPQTVNALSKNMVYELSQALKTFAEVPTVRVIVLKANGKHFCAGHNLSEMVDEHMAEYKFIFDQCTDMMNYMRRMPQPIIAQIHGIATAAGCQLVANCDLAVADRTARFGTPGVKIGLFCTTPMVALSRSVGRKHAFEMLMTGRLISAEEAERFGLVNRVVEADQLEQTVQEMAASIAEASPFVTALGKRAFYAQIEQDEARAYEFAKSTITMNMMAEDAQEGIHAFLEKRDPTWQGR